MSGGHFNYSQGCIGEDWAGQWEDHEINELFADLFGESYCDRDNLAHELDWWLSGDTSEEDYREAVRRFKEKWFGRPPEKRILFYQEKLDEYCQRLKDELGECRPHDADPSQVTHS